jgi:hypothetical protein
MGISPSFDFPSSPLCFQPRNSSQFAKACFLDSVVLKSLEVDVPPQMFA